MNGLSPDTSGEQEADDGAREALFEDLWREHYSTLVGFVRSRAPGLDAEDIVAAVFESAYRAHKNGRGPDTNARAYLYSATRRQMARAIDASDRSVPFDAADTPLDLSEARDGCRRRSKREPVTTVEKGAMRSRWRDDQRGCVGRDSVSAC